MSPDCNRIRRPFGPRTNRSARRRGRRWTALVAVRKNRESFSLSKCERHHAHAYKQKQVKRASNKRRFGRGANVRVHLACASVCKHLLLEARQSCRDNSMRFCNSSLLRWQKLRAWCWARMRPRSGCNSRPDCWSRCCHSSWCCSGRRSRRCGRCWRGRWLQLKRSDVDATVKHANKSGPALVVVRRRREIRIACVDGRAPG